MDVNFDGVDEGIKGFQLIYLLDDIVLKPAERDKRLGEEVARATCRVEESK